MIQNKKEKPAKRVQVMEQIILQQEDDCDDLNIMIGRVSDKVWCKNYSSPRGSSA